MAFFITKINSIRPDRNNYDKNTEKFDFIVIKRTFGFINRGI